MARLPGRSQEHPLRLFPPAVGAIVALAVVVLAGPRGLRGQEVPGEGVGIVAVAGLRVTRVAGESAALPGGALLLRLTPHVAVGGAGWAARSSVELDGGGLEMSFGYGGLVVDVAPRPGRRFSMGGRVLLGAGNAAIHNTVVGIEVDADNALVVEPELTARFELLRRLRLAASAGWRFAAGVDRSAGIEPSDLGGWSVALTLTAGPF